ncbi:DUF5808 domain-containing protein [Caenispirillum bisanense]|uniref:DUF5808 domain-containing protein n=1 Tax=Caenispirillum bisanense TaxID=414052 RepID=A0A286G3T1_9PROT|nr:DUF5808 domain-containing protein [Caenispirillum bisanense]SOD90142.1 hypothetical protein SAMN05421508_101454 [Caenispirillum bisanense]
MSLSQHDLDALWQDDAHWGHGRIGLYFCKRDPRLFVRKRRPSMGWTVNLAHRAAGLVLVGITIVPVLIVVVATAGGGAGVGAAGG